MAYLRLTKNKGNRKVKLVAKRDGLLAKEPQEAPDGSKYRTAWEQDQKKT